MELIWLALPCFRLHRRKAILRPQCSYDGIFPPTLEHFYPLFTQIAQMGLILPRLGLILHRIPPGPNPNPCSWLSRHTPLFGICTYTKQPKHHPKTPLFLAWIWKWAKLTTVWATWTPTGQNVWNVDKSFLEIGKKKKSVVSHAFSYLIECNSHFYQADTFFLPLPRAVPSQIMIVPNLNECVLWSSYEQCQIKLLGENIYDAIWDLRAALSACENGSRTRTRKREAENKERKTLSQDAA